MQLSSYSIILEPANLGGFAIGNNVLLFLQNKYNEFYHNTFMFREYIMLFEIPQGGHSVRFQAIKDPAAWVQGSRR